MRNNERLQRSIDRNVEDRRPGVVGNRPQPLLLDPRHSEVGDLTYATRSFLRLTSSHLDAEPSIGIRHLELLDARRDHLGESPRSCSAPVEPPDEVPVHEHRVALRDALERSLADRGVPRRDREGEEALPAS